MLVPLLILCLLLVAESSPSGEESSGRVVSEPTAGAPGAYWGAWIDGEVYGRSEDAPWDAATWDSFEENAGKGVSIVHFGQPNPWLQEFHARPFELSRDRGAIPMVDMDPDGTSLAEIAAGDFDAQIAEWAAAARDFGGPLFLRWAWEMNGTWFQWGEEAAADPSSYVAVWRRLHDLIEAEGASNVTWVWCPSVVQAGATPLRALYPGDRYVDWNCMDGYNLGRSRPATNWHSFDEIFRRTYDRLLALAPEKPIVIGEVGSTAVGGSKPRWIRKALGTDLPRSYPRVKALVWFNWNHLEDGRRRDWQIETSPESEAAFAESIASPYYAPPDYGDLPPLTPVPADPAAALP